MTSLSIFVYRIQEEDNNNTKKKHSEAVRAHSNGVAMLQSNIL